LESIDWVARLNDAQKQLQAEKVDWAEKLRLAEEQIEREKQARVALLKKPLTQYEAEITSVLERGRSSPSAIKNAGGVLFNCKGGSLEVLAPDSIPVIVSLHPDDSKTNICQLSVAECAALFKLCDTFEGIVIGASSPDQIKLDEEKKKTNEARNVR